jgi:cytoskeletal protein CcmA (bactofilin family)
MPDLSAHDQTTVLGPSSVLKGELTAAGPIRLLGTFEGVLRGAPEITVGPDAQVNATLEGDVVTIEGTVRGDILARQRLTLGPRARLDGDISAGSLTVAEGATFAGRVAVGGDLSLARKGVPAPEPKVALPRPVAVPARPADPRPEVTVAADWLASPGPTPNWVKAATGAD